MKMKKLVNLITARGKCPCLNFCQSKLNDQIQLVVQLNKELLSENLVHPIFFQS